MKHKLLHHVLLHGPTPPSSGRLSPLPIHFPKHTCSQGVSACLPVTDHRLSDCPPVADPSPVRLPACCRPIACPTTRLLPTHHLSDYPPVADPSPVRLPVCCRNPACLITTSLAWPVAIPRAPINSLSFIPSPPPCVQLLGSLVLRYNSTSWPVWTQLTQRLSAGRSPTNRLNWVNTTRLCRR